MNANDIVIVRKGAMDYADLETRIIKSDVQARVTKVRGHRVVVTPLPGQSYQRQMEVNISDVDEVTSEEDLELD